MMPRHLANTLRRNRGPFVIVDAVLAASAAAR
jgi:hypothetical protein